MAITSMPLGVTAVMLYELDFAQQIALCQKLGVTHYSFRPRVIAPEQRDKPFSSHGNHKFDLTPQRLIKEAAQLKKQLLDAGMTPFGTVPIALVSGKEEDLKVDFEGAQAVGAGRVRVSPEGYPKGHFDYEATLNKTVDQFGKVIELAGKHQLKVVIETHCRSLATSPGLAWNICRHFSPSQIGVIFDIANFNIEGMLQPNLAVAVLNEYIDHCHVGGVNATTGDYDPHGFRKRGFQMGMVTEANLYIPDWLAALRDANRHVPLLIESYAPGIPGGLQMTLAAEALQRALAAL